MKTSKQPYNTVVGKSNAPNLQKTSANRKMLQKLTKHNHNVFLSLTFFREKNTDVVRFLKKPHKKDKYDALGVAGLTFIWPGTITHTVQGALRKSLVNTVLFMKFLIPTFINILTFTHFRPQNTNCCIMWRTTLPWLTKKRFDLIKLASVTPNPPH